MRLRFVLLPLLGGCLLPTANALDCDAVVLRSSDGTVDPCDEAACGSCVGACGEGCSLLDADPREYACTTGESWSGDDLCQHWYD